MSGLDWGVVLLLNGSIVAYGFYLSRGVVASTDWFLAGRRLPWWLVGLSNTPRRSIRAIWWPILGDLHARARSHDHELGRGGRWLGAGRFFDYAADVSSGDVYLMQSISKRVLVLRCG